MIEDKVQLDFHEKIIGYGYGYQDICLVPDQCFVESRSDCDVSVFLGEREFSLPVCPSNMKSVVDQETCMFCAENNIFYVMHRFDIDTLQFCKDMIDRKLFVSISVGINGSDYDTLKKIKAANIRPQYITIDIANAWYERARQMVEYIKSNFPSSFLIVGNVATPKACIDLQEWGADAAKIGIANGKVCITRHKTGFCIPMVSCLMSCSSVGLSIPIIADGGIVEHGDIAKAMVSGASFVMAGSLFAGFNQSAGQVIDINDRLYKEYYGSASEKNKGNSKNIEGKKILIKYKGDMNYLLSELKEDLQSSVSYSGGTKLKDLERCKMILVNPYVYQ